MNQAKRMDAATVRERILSGDEIAILDLREWGVFGDGFFILGRFRVTATEPPGIIAKEEGRRRSCRG